MPKFLPVQDIIPGHLNKAGKFYNPQAKTKLFAEEVKAIEGRLVTGLYTSEPRNVYVGLPPAQIEAISEFGDGRFITLGNPTGFPIAMTTGLNMSGFLITNLITPVSPGDAVNKAYADSLVPGGGVTSFNARTGAVLPLIGDYPFFVPLSGTTFGNALTGAIQVMAPFAPGQAVYQNQTISAVPFSSSLFFVDGTGFGLMTDDGTDVTAFKLAGYQMTITGKPGTFTGLSYVADYSAAFTGLSLPNRDYNDARYQPIGGGAVSSVFGRTGAVVAAKGDYGFSLVSGIAAETQGGTGQSAYAVGDLLYSNVANTLTKLATSTVGRVLRLTIVGPNTLPRWIDLAASIVTMTPTGPFTDSNVQSVFSSQVCGLWPFPTSGSQAGSINVSGGAVAAQGFFSNAASFVNQCALAPTALTMYGATSNDTAFVDPTKLRISTVSGLGDYKMDEIRLQPFGISNDEARLWWNAGVPSLRLFENASSSSVALSRNGLVIAQLASAPSSTFSASTVTGIVSISKQAMETVELRADAANVGGLFVNSNRIVTGRQAAIADLSVTGSITGTDLVNAATVLSALNALENKMNSALAMTRAHGLINP